MAHIMIDIETLGTNPGCVITQIAAIPFYIDKDVFLPSGQFSKNIDISSYDEGFTINPSTLKWWSGQDKDVFLKSLQGKANITDSLYELKNMVDYNAGDGLFVWAKSPDFDLSILEYAFNHYGIQVPWGFRDKRDVRTIMDLVPKEDVVSPEIAHDPISDAIAQAHNVWLGLNRAK